MKLFKYSIIIKLLYSLALYPTALADTSVALDKDQKAPFAGILMDQEKANSVKIGLLERDLYKELSESQNRSIGLLKQNMTYSEDKVNKLLEQNDKLSERLQSAQGMNTWERIGFFVLGIAATVGAGLAIRSISR